MGWGIVAWIALMFMVHDSNEGLSTLIFYAGAIGFPVAYWQRKAPEREERSRAEAQQEMHRRRIEIATEVAHWQEEGRARLPRGDENPYLPGPAGSAGADGRSVQVALRPVTLRNGRTVDLPDAEQGRQLLAGTVTDLILAVAEEARRLSRELDTLPGGGCKRARFRRRGGELDWERIEFGSRLTSAAVDLVDGALAWSTARQALLEVLHPAVGELGPVTTAARKATDAVDHSLAFEGPQQRPVLPEGEWPALLTALRDSLRQAAGGLESRTPFEPVRLLHPPQDARFVAHAAPSAIDERLNDFLVDRTQRFTRLAGGKATLKPSDWDLGGQLLDGFLTTEVTGRFRRMTKGTEAIAAWQPDAITAEVRRRLNLGHLAIALNYLTEVSFQMQEYTNRSGMGEPRQPVTIHGNVGAVNIAETIQIIGSNVAAIMERGDERSAAALDALNAAIQQEQALSDQQRAELLDNLADVSEAAANPTERRLVTRARLALTAIAHAGAAIGATSPIAQAITDWQHVYAGLF
ncbi:hypothetical protein [Streptomyces sp. NPDC097619]|uniref:hypothetical protein n=1 Tax=Streptomyces sp. NPDC097619 TaxID=3157228 RepID=UPI00332CC8B1